jgi:hypothetical protein
MIRCVFMFFFDARRVLPAALWVVGLVCAPSLSSAQSDEQRAAARSLATEGATAFNEGRFKDAVDYFTKAQSLMRAPPHLLFLARSHVKLGQLVRAREAYLKIVKETLAANAPKAFRDAQVTAEAEVREVEPKIASLTVRVEGAEGATDVGVMVDGVALPSVLVGLAQPIDPGTHRIEAGATGFRAPSEPVTLAEGEKKTVVLKLEAAPGAAPLVAAPAPAGETPAPAAASATPAPAPVAATQSTGSPTKDTGTQEDSGGGLRIGSYVAFGVGAIGLAGGTLFTLQSASKRKDADSTFAACQAEVGGCRTGDPRSQQTDELDRDADSKKTLGIVGFAVGGVGVAAGITLLVLSSGGDDETKAGVHPWIGLGSAGLRGRF